MIQPQSIQDTAGNKIGQVFQVLGVMIKSRHTGKDLRAGLGQVEHIPEVDDIQRCFPRAADQRPPFFKHHIRRPFYQVGGYPAGDTGQRPHGARDYYHPLSSSGAAGNFRFHIGTTQRD